ncbi:step ii splicing factor [Cystoisospora suis]|uniref:Step ii splicing factor n=1 Tax=Cystoisospora suis TaxID=483139 RepID=A0A2C6L6U6_9APIC|nr:step ii splicing factor [Cystoisospora suis]
MWIGKIGQKSAAFINHKPFHPANWQNQEKIWLAEQKHKEELKKQAELAERRAEELKIQELRRALYSQGTAATKPKKNSAEDGEAVRKAAVIEARKREAARAAAIRAAELRKGTVRSTLYREDVYVGTHSQVWGSFFDRPTSRWGFACCCVCDKSELNCPSASVSSSSPSRLRKHRKRAREHDVGESSMELAEENSTCAHQGNSNDEGVQSKQHTRSHFEPAASSGKRCKAAPGGACRGPSCSPRETAETPSSPEKAGDVDSQREGVNKQKKAALPAFHRSREGGLSSVLQLLKEQKAFGDD